MGGQVDFSIEPSRGNPKTHATCRKRRHHAQLTHSRGWSAAFQRQTRAESHTEFVWWTAQTQIHERLHSRRARDGSVQQFSADAASLRRHNQLTVCAARFAAAAASANSDRFARVAPSEYWIDGSRCLRLRFAAGGNTTRVWWRRPGRMLPSATEAWPRLEQGTRSSRYAQWRSLNEGHLRWHEVSSLSHSAVQGHGFVCLTCQSFCPCMLVQLIACEMSSQTRGSAGLGSGLDIEPSSLTGPCHQGFASYWPLASYCLPNQKCHPSLVLHAIAFAHATSAETASLLLAYNDNDHFSKAENTGAISSADAIK